MTTQKPERNRTNSDRHDFTGQLSPLPASFYHRHTVDVARELLGAWLVRRLRRGKVLAGRIVETEAYLADDPAMHAYRGRTERNAPLFGHPGTSYVYFIYGMYHCFNVVTEAEGTPAAVLIRGLDHIADASGPGKICRALGIDLSHNRLDLTSAESTIRIAQGDKPTEPVVTTTRIGITKNADRPWRFYLLGSPGVSRRDRAAEGRVYE
ncbi:MAG TPA: DNA-3-methyladenine glycosylase [Blastocatellia bacterium]|nr:DNA-3-methyladenine glycosylase [Blastocatellia bacterium]